MIDAIKNIFGLGPKTDYADLVRQGAIIVDVRSKGEYNGGHIKGSLNIPLDSLASNLHLLKDKSNPIITCCASGMRSAAAKNTLKAKGYATVHNGGGWLSLQRKVS
jgi:phage shock protein E